MAVSAEDGAQSFAEALLALQRADLAIRRGPGLDMRAMREDRALTVSQHALLSQLPPGPQQGWARDALLFRGR